MQLDHTKSSHVSRVMYYRWDIALDARLATHQVKSRSIQFPLLLYGYAIGSREHGRSRRFARKKSRLTTLSRDFKLYNNSGVQKSIYRMSTSIKTFDDKDHLDRLIESVKAGKFYFNTTGEANRYFVILSYRTFYTKSDCD